jgi:hypothetical protein
LPTAPTASTAICSVTTEAELLEVGRARQQLARLARDGGVRPEPVHRPAGLGLVLRPADLDAAVRRPAAALLAVELQQLGEGSTLR